MIGVFLSVVYGGMIALVVVNIAYLRRTKSRSVSPESPPLVSILIPARNEARNLRRLIPTLLHQQYKHFEIIVYDDASDDETAHVLAGFADPRIRTMTGDGPPPGWVGKVNALYQATRDAKGDVFLFLDADTQLRHDRSLSSLVSRFLAVPSPRVFSGIPRLCGGGGGLLVSMVTFSLLVFFPVPLASVGRRGSLGVMAGGCWMIEREVYLEHEPHLAHPDEVLDDVVIARYLKSRGAAPHMHDLQTDVEVFMYESHGEAWNGFRKNAYLIAGGHWRFTAALTWFTLMFVVAPFVWWPSLFALYLLKGMADRFAGYPLTTTLLAPLSFVLTVALNIDSAISNTSGTVHWKGRIVNTRKP